MKIVIFRAAASIGTEANQILINEVNFVKKSYKSFNVIKAIY